jgi:hypothetical protein
MLKLTIEKINKDWDLLDNKGNVYFLNQLNNELIEEHFLFNRAEKAIMKRLSQDDVLYLLKDGKFAIVHLTYSKNNSSKWPAYKEFETIGEVRNYIENLED